LVLMERKKMKENSVSQDYHDCMVWVVLLEQMEQIEQHPIQPLL